MIETILSLCSSTKQVIDTYNAVTGLIRGDSNIRLIKDFIQNNYAVNNSIHNYIERLSDHILYAPKLLAVKDINCINSPLPIDGRAVREYLDPVQRAIGQPILASAIIPTPEKMQRIMAKNPWEVLLDVRPVGFFTARLPPEGVLVQFEYGGMSYMGWQTRGVLPILFDCELYALVDKNSGLVKAEIIPEVKPKFWWFTRFLSKTIPQRREADEQQRAELEAQQQQTAMEQQRKESEVQQQQEAQQIKIINNCQYPVKIAINYYSELNSNWNLLGWWAIDGNKSASLFDSENNLLIMGGTMFYYYAETADGSLAWFGGDDAVTFNLNGRLLKMQKSGVAHVELTCNTTTLIPV